MAAHNQSTVFTVRVELDNVTTLTVSIVEPAGAQRHPCTEGPITTSDPRTRGPARYHVTLPRRRPPLGSALKGQ